jgi:biotin transport system substrate-specific component
MFTRFLYRSSTVTQVLMGVLGLSLMSQITIPLNPVPITLQTVAVLLIGLVYRRKEAFLTMASYLALGSVGLPIFANYSGGIAKLLSPVGGYYVGFMLAVVIMAYVREKISKDTLVSDIGLSFLGSAILYTLGVAWLAYFIGFVPALMGGVVPFILPGLVKSVLLGGILRYVR